MPSLPSNWLPGAMRVTPSLLTCACGLALALFASSPLRRYGIHDSHLHSTAAAAATVFFFVGDTQAHSFDSSPTSVDNAEAVSRLLTRALADAIHRFDEDPSNVVWTAGNNDGPHDAIFKQQDASTVAWATAMLRAGIVTDQLGIQYSNLSGANSSSTQSQTDVFRQLGFYTKALPTLTNRSYSIVLNTNLGG